MPLFSSLMLPSGSLDGTPSGSTVIHPSPDIAMSLAGLHNEDDANKN
jgi:hypothetical protein